MGFKCFKKNEKHELKQRNQILEQENTALAQRLWDLTKSADRFLEESYGPENDEKFVKLMVSHPSICLRTMRNEHKQDLSQCKKQIKELEQNLKVKSRMLRGKNQNLNRYDRDIQNLLGEKQEMMRAIERYKHKYTKWKNSFVQNERMMENLLDDLSDSETLVHNNFVEK